MFSCLFCLSRTFCSVNHGDLFCFHVAVLKWTAKK
ncbi:hypothetical protein CAEBREN_32471 [Caenorhabditis brenneri]|uniref:Uncharacterized protein n=1 Tax=Caenorhabditis brenneri TaxID=135651 RepID=G0M9M0_CAEBE|nr:hypothetical protein CAEBREN_32471 [Caenorhabditis brenneri]